MLSLLLDYTKLCPKVCPLCPGLTIFFLSNTYPMNTFVKIFVSLAWVSQILSFQHWCYKNFCQNICLSWLIGCHEILSQTLHPPLRCHKLLLQILPPPLGCHRVTAIRKVPARAGDRQSPKFAHWAGDGRSSSMGKSIVFLLGWSCWRICQ